MLVVSGRIGGERPTSRLRRLPDWLMKGLSSWPASTVTPSRIGYRLPTRQRSGTEGSLAHPWFVTPHPFDDGNGRIARAIADFAPARSEGTAHRFYSISAQIRRERSAYYDILEQTQKTLLNRGREARWAGPAFQEAGDMKQHQEV